MHTSCTVPHGILLRVCNNNSLYHISHEMRSALRSLAIQSSTCLLGILSLCIAIIYTQFNLYLYHMVLVASIFFALSYEGTQVCELPIIVLSWISYNKKPQILRSTNPLICKPTVYINSYLSVLFDFLSYLYYRVYMYKGLTPDIYIILYFTHIKKTDDTCKVFSFITSTTYTSLREPFYVLVYNSLYWSMPSKPSPNSKSWYFPGEPNTPTVLPYLHCLYQQLALT